MPPRTCRRALASVTTTGSVRLGSSVTNEAATRQSQGVRARERKAGTTASAPDLPTARRPSCSSETTRYVLEASAAATAAGIFFRVEQMRGGPSRAGHNAHLIARACIGSNLESFIRRGKIPRLVYSGKHRLCGTRYNRRILMGMPLLKVTASRVAIFRRATLVEAAASFTDKHCSLFDTSEPFQGDCHSSLSFF